MSLLNLKSTLAIVLIFPLFLNAGSNISGDIVDSNTGNPLAGADVFLDQTAIGDASNLGGEFLITNVQDGDYTLTASYLGYKSKSISIQIESGKDLYFKIELDQEVLEGQTVTITAQAKGQASLLSSNFKESNNALEKTNSNSPVNLFQLNKLSLEGLGFLIATWEHRVFVTACMLQINPFDQYGVAAGKLIAKKFLS